MSSPEFSLLRESIEQQTAKDIEEMIKEEHPKWDLSFLKDGEERAVEVDAEGRPLKPTEGSVVSPGSEAIGFEAARDFGAASILKAQGDNLSKKAADVAI